jgi:UDP-MurNAc hydroxylase|tara:strand:+ start:2172 stop:3503 length:1332 start_codon:yes stop_codon:yes gene_type:complete
MKITHISSATVLIENKSTKILTDPWLIGDVYYGSWTHYPPLEDSSLSQLNDVDYIYISHIHPDHMSRETLEKLNPEIPVLIHNYESKFLKNNLIKWGRKVIELNHGDKFHCGDGLNIRIYAADDCDPEICFKFFGCGKMESKFGSTGIDTMSVIENGEKTILNVNDCPFELSRKALNRVMRDYNEIDLLLVGYTGAGSYPQCWHYSDEDKLLKYGIAKKNKFLKMGLDFLNNVKPKYYMPFAGTYVLKGKYAKLEKFKVVPELQEALEFYEKNYSGKGFLLNSYEYHDLNTGNVSKQYDPVDYEEKMHYVENVLSKEKYDYELDEEPTLEQVESLLFNCYKRYNEKREEIKFNSDTNVYIYLPENKMCKISCKGEGFKVIDRDDFRGEKCVTYKLDNKLLYRILKGPRFAHWNNAEIGSHISFSRNPEKYERGLYYSMNFFHS